jgi:hypothetical protein
MSRVWPPISRVPSPGSAIALGRPQELVAFIPFPGMGQRPCPKPTTDRQRRLGATFANAARGDLGSATWGLTLVQDAGPGWVQEPVGKA